MITNLGEIYADVLFRSGKDLRGGAITPSNFNRAIATINQRFLNQQQDAFEKGREVTIDLRTLIKTRGSAQFPPLTFTPVLASDPNQGGYCDIPEDFWYEARSNYIQYANQNCSSTSEYKQVVLVTQHEFDAVMNDSNVSPILNPKDGQPVIVIQNNLFYIYPYIRYVSMAYIRVPKTPYFDYDIISGIPVFLPAGETHVNSTVEPQGSPSLTVEFEYPENCVDNLTDMIKTQCAIYMANRFSLETQIPDKV